MPAMGYRSAVWASCCMQAPQMAVWLKASIPEMDFERIASRRAREEGQHPFFSDEIPDTCVHVKEKPRKCVDEACRMDFEPRRSSSFPAH